MGTPNFEKMLQLKGRKLNMTQVFEASGRVIPVTRVAIDPEHLSDVEGLKGKPVTVVGTSKGKGFAGVIKRWGFKHQHTTRGASDKIRTGGSIGCQTPGKVFKGKKMAGHLGASRVTISGLKIVDIDPNAGVLLVSGSVPGARNSMVEIRVVEA